MALIGSSGYLKIASNLGSASKFLGLRPGKTIVIAVTFLKKI